MGTEFSAWTNGYSDGTDYLNKNQDVMDAWKQFGQGQSQEAFAQTHWMNYGQKEGRGGWVAPTGATGNTYGLNQTDYNKIVSGNNVTPDEVKRLDPKDQLLAYKNYWGNSSGLNNVDARAMSDLARSYGANISYGEDKGNVLKWDGASYPELQKSAGIYVNGQYIGTPKATGLGQGGTPQDYENMILGHFQNARNAGILPQYYNAQAGGLLAQPASTGGNTIASTAPQPQVFSGGGSSQQASVAPSGLLAADTPTSYQAPAFTPQVQTEQPWQTYLTGNPDVLAAWNNTDAATKAAWGVTTPEQFATTHFQKFGQQEGRKWGNAAAGSPTIGVGGSGGGIGGTSGQTGGTTNTGIQQAPVAPSSSSQYFQNYPELKAVWDGMTPDQKAEYGNNPDQFARTHYQKFGRQEGRTFGNANAAQQYFQLYPEVKAAWDALTTAQKAEYGNNAEQFAWTHYQKFGKAERRENPWGSDGYTNNGSTYDANTERWMVNADQTVEGRLAGLLDDDNPLVQMARTRGMQDASARGLLNSSLGAQAGALAAYQYAMPIAQQDATTYASAARQNASEQTNANLANANARTGRGNLEYSTQANIDQQNRVLDSQQAHDKDMAGINNDAQMARLNAQIEATYRQNEQSIDANFRTSYRAQLGNLQSQYAQMYAAIQSSDIPPEQKTEQLAVLDTFFGNYTDFFGSLFSSTGDMSKAFAAIPRAD